MSCPRVTVLFIAFYSTYKRNPSTVSLLIQHIQVGTDFTYVRNMNCYIFGFNVGTTFLFNIHASKLLLRYLEAMT